MEKPPQSFDVCIVCALPEEARAFLEVVRQQCEGALEERSSPRHQYSYRFATIKNDKDEPLNLHISWLPRYGPQEMTLHLSHVLEECQPRIAIMTGICAGDGQHVHLGDLVVAERTFTYDNGKFILDDADRRIHLHDTMTYQLDANMLQFLGLFDKWKPLVARLKRPPFPPEQRKRRKIACHIKPMASGSAVRADHPFEDVQAPVRGTVAIDMEGAAFSLVMSRHPLIRWIVVKGVCDYADRDKNDTYHDYAARASALYALSFIQAYVTNERLPRPDGSSLGSRAGSFGVWNVPHRRNPHFTGRDEMLDRLHQQLTPTHQNDSVQAHRVALTQPLAVKGLGGIGKTQVAVEYAYRSREQGHYTHTLWINAASEETTITSFVTIAELLPAFAANNEPDQRKLVEAVKHWLEQCNERWLLIFDNADDIALVRDYLPKLGKGSILLTTRAHAVGSLATSIEVDTMGFVEGTQLLLRRAQRFEHASDEEINQAGNIVVALDHFPLALDQAGAYIEETLCSFEEYLDLYRTHRQTLLARRGMPATDYPYSVATTWLLSFQKVQQANPAAAELLELCSFLAPDRIPEELLRDGAAHWPTHLQRAVANPVLFQQLIEDLLKFSLVKRLVEEHALSIHRLVQAVQMDTMELEMQRQWAESVVRAVNDVFPKDLQDTTVWPQCQRYLDQAQACDVLIGKHTLLFVEAADLLDRTSIYLDVHALYTIAEPLALHALAIREQELGTSHPDTALSLNNLATLYKHQEKYREAEPLYQLALAIREQESGASHPETAISLNDLAALYYAQGKYKQAEPLYERALMIDTQVYGVEHSEVATDLNNLATLYYSQGRYEEAEPLLQRALQIRERQLGVTHPDTASSLDNLASLYADQGRYREAEPLYQRALAIYEQQLGATHPSTILSLNNLGLVYQALGKYKEAESLYQRALANSEQQLGATSLSTGLSLNNLAGLYLAQGKHREAEPLYQRALAISEQQLGATHPSTATSLNNLAELYRAQGKYSEAEPLYQQALVIYEQQLGATHPFTATILNNLGLVYQALGKYREAESLYQRALAIREQQLGTMHPDTMSSLNTLAQLYRLQGKYGEAEPLYQRALAISEQQLGATHPSTATSLNNLAELYRAQGKYSEAEPLYQQVLAIYEQQFGPEHSRTQAVRKNYSFLLRSMGRDTESGQIAEGS